MLFILLLFIAEHPLVWFLAGFGLVLLAPGLRGERFNAETGCLGNECRVFTRCSCGFHAGSGTEGALTHTAARTINYP